MKNLLYVILVVILLLVGATWWSRSLSSGDSSVISRNGIHWHPELEIYLGEEQIEIPQNLGLIGQHSPVHTHDDLPIIHLEFASLVREDDVRLGEFFRVWGKDISSFGSLTSMTVNGEESFEFENHLMRDGDKIVLRYK